jgi:hypothetical protein
MNMRIAAVAAVFLMAVGCNAPKAEKPAGDASKELKLPSIDEAVSKLKTDLKDAAETAKTQIAENAEAEIEKIAKELVEIAADFEKNAGQLQGEAKDQFEKLRIEFNDKKAVFEQKFKAFREDSDGKKPELLKGLYDALAEMKDAMDRAAETFRKGAATQSESKPS